MEDGDDVLVAGTNGGLESLPSWILNRKWLEVTRPMVEAFFHARFMVEMAVRYGRELEEPPTLLPSGWAALLYLYKIR